MWDEHDSVADCRRCYLSQRETKEDRATRAMLKIGAALEPR